MKSSATIVTPHARRYMIELCAIFGRDVAEGRGERESRIRLASGAAALRASPDTLMVVATAHGAAELGRLETALARGLGRLADGEPGFRIDWRRRPD